MISRPLGVRLGQPSHSYQCYLGFSTHVYCEEPGMGRDRFLFLIYNTWIPFFLQYVSLVRMRRYPSTRRTARLVHTPRWRYVPRNTAPQRGHMPRPTIFDRRIVSMRVSSPPENSLRADHDPLSDRLVYGKSPGGSTDGHCIGVRFINSDRPKASHTIRYASQPYSQ